MSLEDLDGKSIERFVHNWRQGMDTGFQNSFIVERFEQGIGEAILVDDEIAEQRVLLITSKTKLQIKELYQSILQLQGKKVSFWFIDQLSPLEIQDDIGALSTNIVIKNNEYILDKRRIYILKKDGTEFTRKIQSSIVGEDTTDIAVNTIVDEILVDDIRCAFILRIMRMDTDIVNLSFPNNIFCETNFGLVELVKEYT